MSDEDQQGKTESTLIEQNDKQVLSTMELHINAHRRIYVTCFFVIGLCNNFGYGLIQSSAQNIANKFKDDNLMPMFNLALITCSAFTRITNSRYLIKISHKKRVVMILTTGFISFMLMVLGNFLGPSHGQTGFYIALLSAVIQGISQALGEAVMLGYMKAFPPQMVGFFGSGTGFAGFFSALFYLAMQAVGLQNQYVFLIITPFVIGGYWFCFIWVQKKQVNSILKTSAMKDSQNQLDAEEHEAKINMKLGWNDNNKRVYAMVRYYCLNLGFVYLFEYIIITSFADILSNITKNNDKTNWIKDHSFIIMVLLYNVGVLTSRSSLSIIQVNKIWIITCWQMIHFIIAYIVTAITFHKNYLVLDIYIVFLYFIIVGLMGGGSYVNVAYLILNDPKLKKTERELSFNMSTVHNDVGVLIASLISLLITRVQYPIHDNN